jgi:hypothetical protein
MAWEWKNRVWNAIATPVRMWVGAPVHAAVGLAKTWLALGKDSYDIAMETANEIQETISEAWKRGKWYHKAANIGIIAPFWSAAKVVTWSIQTTLNPIINGVFNVAKTWWGFLKNEFNSIKSVFSKKPVSDFSFEKLKLTPTRKSLWHPKNLLIWGAATWAAAVVATNPPVDSKTSLDENSKQTISDLTKRLEDQDKTNQELQKSMLAMQDQMQKQTKFMEQQLQQKDALIASLQGNNSKQIAQDGLKNQVEEKIDSASESSKKKKALKKKQLA